MKSLNALLPKGYILQEGNIFIVDNKKRTITYNPELMHSRASTLVALHEIGHARNYESGKIEKNLFDTLSFNEKFRAGKDIAIMYAKQFTRKMGLRVKAPYPQWLLDKKRDWMAKDERAANAYALQEGRALEKEGFHVFAGFKNTEDIRNFFNMQLMTYEATKIHINFLQGVDLSDLYSSQFVKQHVLDKKLDEATSSIRT